ncbi:Cation-chloride cotransporter [Blattamonas nauphoetae]|uniref:Cation-chloride cotransporter n=1 Tax=Blattamonas nauphoetae TaxID=2049346 RepID=A0ABQ9XI48_9EUKA|nr:Cation-chloride cotransporter [Blattamonas nauphoetae]
MSNIEGQSPSSTIALDEPAPQPSRRQLGWLSGVFISVTLNMITVMYLEKFGELIGRAGIVLLTIILVFGVLMDVFTMLSVSEVIGTGEMKGGGTYFVLSRTLGIEMGGALGILMVLGLVFSASMNIVGITDLLQSTVSFFSPANTSVTPFGHYLSILFVQILVLVTCVIVVKMGAKAYEKTTMALFICLAALLVILLGAFCFVPAQTLPGLSPSGKPVQLNLTSFSSTTFASNLGSHFHDPTAESGMTFMRVVGVTMSLLANIFVGLNLSSELRNPQKDIPKGTFLSITICSLLFFLTAIILAARVPFSSLLADPMIMARITHPALIAIAVCLVSLSSILGAFITSSRVFMAIAQDDIFPFLSWFIKPSKRSSSSSDSTPKGPTPTRSLIFIACLVGTILLFLPLVDNITGLASFSALLSIICYFFVNFACFLHSSIDTPNWRSSFKYSSRFTALFGMALTASAAFVLSPTMLAIALVIFFLLALLLYFFNEGRTQDWGNVSQSLLFANSRRALLTLRSQPTGKFWTPNMLVFADASGLEIADKKKKKRTRKERFENVIMKQDQPAADLEPLVEEPTVTIPSEDKTMMQLCDALKESGTVIFASVVVPSLPTPAPPAALVSLNVDGLDKNTLQQAEDQTQAINIAIESMRLQAFPAVVVSETYRQGVQSLVLSAGIGGLRPNTAAFKFWEPRLPDIKMRSPAAFASAARFVGSLHDVVCAEQNFLLFRNMGQLEVPTKPSLRSRMRPQSKNKNPIARPFLDVWLTETDLLSPSLLPSGLLPTNPDSTFSWSASMALVFAFLLHKHPNWTEHKVRARLLVLRGESSSVDESALRREFDERLSVFLDDLRIPCERDVVVQSGRGVDTSEGFSLSHMKQHLTLVNTTITQLSSQTKLVFLPIDSRPPVDLSKLSEADCETLQLTADEGSSLPSAGFTSPTNASSHHHSSLFYPFLRTYGMEERQSLCRQLHVTLPSEYALFDQVEHQELQSKPSLQSHETVAPTQAVEIDGRMRERNAEEYYELVDGLTRELPPTILFFATGSIVTSEI